MMSAMIRPQQLGPDELQDLRREMRESHQEMQQILSRMGKTRLTRRGFVVGVPGRKQK